MTGLRDNSDPYAMYRCTTCRVRPFHGQSRIAEAKLRPWIEAEMARLHPPDRSELALGSANEEARCRSALPRARALPSGLARRGDRSRHLARGEAADRRPAGPAASSRAGPPAVEAVDSRAPTRPSMRRCGRSSARPARSGPDAGVGGLAPPEWRRGDGSLAQPDEGQDDPLLGGGDRTEAPAPPAGPSRREPRPRAVGPGLARVDQRGDELHPGLVVDRVAVAVDDQQGHPLAVGVVPVGDSQALGLADVEQDVLGGGRRRITGLLR